MIEKEVVARGGHVGDAPGEPHLDPKTGLYLEDSHSIALPVVSSSGTQALVVSESVSGPLAGGGGIALWKKDANGAWRRSGWSGLWIS
jgi:hypothetical protein